MSANAAMIVARKERPAGYFVTMPRID